MKNFLSLLVLFGLFALNSCGQTNTNNKQSQQRSDIKVGGPCEGCEAIYESPVDFEKLSNMVWLPDWSLKKG